MHPLDTDRRRQLLAASVRLERCLRAETTLPRQIARARLVGLLRPVTPWSWISL
ncbi:MAG: hypothetical protein AB8G16_01500 [Gammaproteobacteria bacterium]